VHFLENHDQVANTDRGRRLVDLARPADLRAMTALLLLLPAMPMLFQGQEFGSRRPFVYFADHQAPLRDHVAKGRREFLDQFERLRDPAVAAARAAPHEAASFRQCQLHRDPHDADQAAWRALHRDLLGLRCDRPRCNGAHVLDGAAPDATLLLLRYFGDNDADWLLLFNAGADRDVASLSEPLIAPPAGRTWQPRWSSEAFMYGGQGEMSWSPGRWPVSGHALVVMQAAHTEDDPA
jgi:maltooligosyltrehalose trehalohydrolase